GFVSESASAADGAKPSSKVEWENKDLIAEEIAVIIPIHENVIEDQEYDIWGEVETLVQEESGRVLDVAVFFGESKPSTWDDALVPAAVAASNTVADGDGRDLAEDFNLAFGQVEDDGFDVNAVYTGRFLRQRLRGLRDDNGQPIYLESLRSDGNTRSVYGED